MKRQTWWIAFCAFLAGLLVWLAFFWEPAPGGNAASAQSSALLQPAGRPLGGDFTLDSPGGKLSLKDYRGKAVLLYFGYTFCPDVCPTSLATMAQALSALSAEESAKVQGIFISVDPERDTMEILKVYAPFFHPSITGATGTPAEVAQVARLYGASYMKQKSVDERPYTVDHSSFTYLIGPDGKLAAALPHGTPAADVLAATRKALGSGRAN